MPPVEAPRLKYGVSGHAHDPHGVMGLVIDPALKFVAALYGAFFGMRVRRTRRPPDPGPEPCLRCCRSVGRPRPMVRESLRLQFVCELCELIEIDARPEPEGMRNDLRRGRRASRRRVRRGRRGSRLTASLKGTPSSSARCFRRPAKSSSSVESGPHALAMIGKGDLMSRHRKVRRHFRL